MFAEDPVRACSGANGVVLLTEWADIVEADWESIASNMRAPKLLFDGRNALNAKTMLELGLEYVGIGRCAPRGSGVTITCGGGRSL